MHSPAPGLVIRYLVNMWVDEWNHLASCVIWALTCLEGTLGGIKLTAQEVWLVPWGPVTQLVGPEKKRKMCGCQVKKLLRISIWWQQGTDKSRALVSQGSCVTARVTHPGIHRVFIHRREVGRWGDRMPSLGLATPSLGCRKLNPIEFLLVAEWMTPPTQTADNS